MKQLEMSNGDVRDVCDHDYQPVYNAHSDAPEHWWCANCGETRRDDPTA